MVTEARDLDWGALIQKNLVALALNSKSSECVQAVLDAAAANKVGFRDLIGGLLDAACLFTVWVPWDDTLRRPSLPARGKTCRCRCCMAAAHMPHLTTTCLASPVR